MSIISFSAIIAIGPPLSWCQMAVIYQIMTFTATKSFLRLCQNSDFLSEAGGVIVVEPYRVKYQK